MNAPPRSTRPRPGHACGNGTMVPWVRITSVSLARGSAHHPRAHAGAAVQRRDAAIAARRSRAGGWHTGSPVRADPRARARRHGRRVPRARYAARPARRDQVPAVERRRAAPSGSSSRRARRRGAATRTSSSSTRSTTTRGIAVHGARVPRGHAARAAARWHGRALPVGRAVELMRAGRARARARARARHRPPRSQARQHRS